MMNKNKLSLLVIVAAFVAGAYFYPSMPAMIASHWGAGGQANGYTPKFWGLFLLPLMTLAIYGLFLLLPKIDPLKANYTKFRNYYDGFLLAFVLFMGYVYGLTIAWNEKIEFNMTVAIIPAFALFFYFIGAVLENAKQNWFIGIRTPWTLSSEKVWDKTNKLGAKIFKVVAILSLISIFFDSFAFLATIFLLLIAAFYLVVYSYIIYRKVVK